MAESPGFKAAGEENGSMAATADELSYLSEIFKIFADPTRLSLISALHGRELCVQELSEASEMSQSAVSHALRLLRAHRIVRARRDGRNMRYALDDHHIAGILSMGLEHIRGDECDEEA